MVGKYYQSTKKNRIIVFDKWEDVATEDQVNDQWTTKYHAIPTKSIDYSNCIAIFKTREELSSVFIEVIEIIDNVVKVKLYGLMRNRYTFPTSPTIKNVSELPDSLLGYIHLSDFTKYTKLVSPDYNPTKLESKLISICKTIIHTGDMGSCFYNSTDKKVIWCASDGDGSDDNTTDMDEIIARFMIEDVNDVEIYVEEMPNDSNYEEIIYY